MFQQIQREYGVPVANMFYDGEGDINAVVDSYVANLVEDFGETVSERASADDALRLRLDRS